MTILREWRAEIRTRQSKEYAEYIRTSTIARSGSGIAQRAG
jgi:hypothetical protein